MSNQTLLDDYEVRQADAWDVHPTGQVILILDPPYGINADPTWDSKTNARQFYSMDFLSSLTRDASDAIVVIYGVDEMLVPLAAEVMQNGRPFWRYRNMINFMPDRVRQGMNHRNCHRLPYNSKALVLQYHENPWHEEDMTKATFFEGFRPALDFMQKMAASRGLSAQDMVRISGCTTCSHYLIESEFLFPSPERFRVIFKDATEEELHEYTEARRSYTEARRSYTEAHVPFHHVMISDGIPYKLDQRRDDTYGHPTAKQIGELKPLLEVMPHWHVVDPFCGSGMTAKVCHMLGRGGVSLSDIDPQWVEATNDRIKKLKEQA